MRYSREKKRIISHDADSKRYCSFSLRVGKPEAGNTSAEPDQRLASFVGEWRCGETLLETDECYSGYLALRVEEDGEFSMYDEEAGNPGISGLMEYSSDNEGRFTLVFTKE